MATTDRYATEAGTAVLSEGGNAIDAAVAASLALAVVNPEAGNLGGSGFLLAQLSDGRVEALDYRSVAPAASSRDMFIDENGDVSERSQVGPLAVAVPGSVRGLWEAHASMGVLPWARVVEPAIALARGFTVTDRLARSYPPHIVAGLRRFQDSARIFLPEGCVPRVGETLTQPDLAETLERIRNRGADGFYQGDTARLIANAMRAAGGIIEEDDLASYRVVRRRPLRFRYRDHTIISMPPSSSGGVTLAGIAHMLADRKLSALEWHGAEHVHLLAEAWKRAFADRNHHLADPDFADVPVDELVSPAHGARRGREIGPRASERGRVEPAPTGAKEGDHTTHVSVVDAEGNAVSTTTTLNTWYGSKWVASGTGVLMNNDMDDFTAKPGAANHFGLVQGRVNDIVPGKRPLSAMTPTLLLDPDGALRLVVGAPGGATIITSVFQVISNMLDYGMGIADAVAAPRVHHQHAPDRIDVEPEGLPGDVIERLRDLGHDVDVRPDPWGDVQAVAIHEDGVREGAADPRRGGVAMAI